MTILYVLGPGDVPRAATPTEIMDCPFVAALVAERDRLQEHADALVGLLQDAGHTRWARDEVCPACAAITAYRLDCPAATRAAKETP